MQLVVAGSKLRRILEDFPSFDRLSSLGAWRRLHSLTKPKRSLGMLEELAVRIAGITSNSLPELRRKVVVVMAADHGVVEDALVSAFPQEVTKQMVLNFLRGGAAINVLASWAEAELRVVDVGVKAEFEEDGRLLIRKVGWGTRSMLRGPAMSREEAFRSIEVGVEVAEELVKEGFDLVAVGDMGIGNTTSSAAVAATLLNEEASKLVGRGTGLGEVALRRKAEVVEEAIKLNRPNPDDPIDVLAKVGGFEIGGIAGLILGAARHRVPVILDGYITGASALIAWKLCSKVRDFLIASHLSAEQGHGLMLRKLGLRPLLKLDLRLGEGTGAVLAMKIVDASLRILREMATFEEASVSRSDL